MLAESLKLIKAVQYWISILMRAFTLHLPIEDPISYIWLFKFTWSFRSNFLSSQYTLCFAVFFILVEKAVINDSD